MKIDFIPDTGRFVVSDGSIERGVFNCEDDAKRFASACDLIFEQKLVYGTKRFYPQDNISKAFTVLLGRVCLNEKQINLLKESGVIVTVQ